MPRHAAQDEQVGQDIDDVDRLTIAIRLGYLRAVKRLDADASGHALARLNDDLRRSETITDDPGPRSA